MAKKKRSTPLTIEEPTFLERLLLEGFRPYISLVVIGFIVYGQALFFGLTHSDDDILVLRNFHFISNLSNFFKAFQTDVFLGGASDVYYRPLMTVSLMIDALFSKTKPVPFIFHLSNILIHLLVSCLTYMFFIKITNSKKTSYLFAALFTVHPVLTQAVAPIPGRNDTLLALFVLPSFMFFLSYIRTKDLSYFFWHLLFFGLALFTKETALVLVLICPLYFWLIVKEKIAVVQNLIFPAGWLALLLVWFLLREAAFAHPMEYTFAYIARSILSNSPAILLYIGKIIFPFNLSVTPILQDSTLWYGIIATIIVVMLLIISANRRSNHILFGFLWFAFFLVPILIGVNPDLPHNFSEHRVYLPLMGFMIVLMEIDWLKEADFKKKGVLILCAGVILLFSVVNIVHGRNFKDRLSFWLNAVKNSPHYVVAHSNLGSAYYSMGNLEEAEKQYMECAKLGPLHPIIHNNLGLIYVRRGLLKEAEVEFKKALENPIFYDALINLGQLYYRTGREREAEPLWKKALEVNPNYAEAYSHLAVYYYNLKDFPQAAYYLNEFQKRGGRIDSALVRALQPYMTVK
jgi:protein O-mannosyl-transferase